MNILNCPFCGGSIKRSAQERQRGHDMEFYVACNCGAELAVLSDKEGAVRRWNTRAHPVSAPKPAECSEGTVIYLAGDTVQLGDLIGPDLEIGDRMFTHPAPAAVVLPERKEHKSHGLTAEDTEADGWNACLDEAARLNGLKP